MDSVSTPKSSAPSQKAEMSTTAGGKKRSRNGDYSMHADGGKKKKADDEMSVEGESDLEEIVYEDDSDDEDMMECDGTGEKKASEKDGESTKRVWNPAKGDKLGEDEELDFDPESYEMLHKMGPEWPCLSFDIVEDGTLQKTYPLECTLVAGSQAAEKDQNRLYVMKWRNLRKMDASSESEDSDSDNDIEFEGREEPVLHASAIEVPDTILRTRMMPGTMSSRVCATWCDDGNVYMWDLKEEIENLKNVPAMNHGKSQLAPIKKKPLFTYSGHETTGFALAWSRQGQAGRFLSGDDNGVIRYWTPIESGWKVQDEAFLGHTGSVEDLEWKRTGAGADKTFASCSSDGTVRVWDVRCALTNGARKPQITLKHNATDADVNVLSWNPHEGDLLAAGGDDGSFKVWDLRFVEEEDQGCMAEFEYHRGPITSINWHPTDDTGLCVSSADNSISLWDMAIENNEEEGPVAQEYAAEGAEEYPPQLLFIHQGQNNITEAKWNPQIPGMVVSTAFDGFNVFKPCKACNF